MKIFDVVNFLFVILLINTIINSQSQTEYEIPFSYNPDNSLPTIDVFLGEETTPNLLILDIGKKNLGFIKIMKRPQKKKT